MFRGAALWGKHRARALTGVALSALVAGSPAVVWAQSAGANKSSEEIVVTAERRNSTVQETPLSITALTGEQLTERGISNVEALVTETPGVSMESEGPGRTQFDIRGLTSTGGSSSTVGYYLDDVPVTPPTSALSAAGKVEIDPDLYDLARVEVLRGPQGTLYGASSMGGTIRLITNDPSFDGYQASVQTGLSGTEGGGVNYSGNFMVNIPLIDDQLALRVVGTEKYDSGFIDRVVLNDFPLPNGNQRGNVLAAPVAKLYPNVNDDRTQGFRVSLLWKPMNGLTIEPAVFSQRLTTGGLSAIDNPPLTMAHYQPADVSEAFTQNFDDYSLRIKYALDDIAIESVTSALYTKSFIDEDDAESYLFAFGPLGSSGYASSSSTVERHKSHQYTEELRVSSTDDGPLQWVAGAFYSSFQDELMLMNRIPDLLPVFGTTNAFTDAEPDNLDQEAVFGEVNYSILPELKATVGLRYFRYDFSFSQHGTGLAATPGYFTGKAAASGVTPKATLTYTPQKDLLFYGTVSEGFRPGGPNLPIPVSGVVNCTSSFQQIGLQSEPLTYQPDTVWNYEIGEKARFLDGKVTVNGDLYYIDWQKIQQQTTLPCGYYFTANSGTAFSEGAELEIDAKLLPGLKLEQSVGFTRAVLSAETLPGNTPVGQQLPDVPRWTFSTTLDYRTDLTDDYGLHAMVIDNFVGSEYDYSAVPFPDTRKPLYNIVNARLGIEGSSWSASLYTDNLFDRRAILGFNRFETENNPWLGRLIVNRPRTVGLTFEKSF